MEDRKGDRNITGAVLQELKENPYHKFNIAFALMTIIPFLAFFYLLVNTSSAFDTLVGQTGGILSICIFIAVCGFGIGYIVINNMLKRLIVYAARLKRSDQLKSTAIAHISHELKNPLTIIKTNISTLLEGLAGQLNESQQKLIALCSKISDRMTWLINDLLDIHKIEAGMVDMNRERCDFSKLLESQINEFGPIVSKKGIKLVTELLDAELMIWADGGKLTQVINNLLSNAIKYTPEGKYITVKAYPTEQFVRFEVADKGPGIPSDKIEKVFDKFERLDHSKEGTGLGLSITKDIVELHKGRIWVESLQGRGSTFVVVLPRDLRRVLRQESQPLVS